MKLVSPGAHSSPFMASNLPPQMLLESFVTVAYTLDSGDFVSRFTPLDPRVPFQQARLWSDIVIYYAQMVLYAGK